MICTEEDKDEHIFRLLLMMKIAAMIFVMWKIKTKLKKNTKRMALLKIKLEMTI